MLYVEASGSRYREAARFVIRQTLSDYVALGGPVRHQIANLLFPHLLTLASLGRLKVIF